MATAAFYPKGSGGSGVPFPTTNLLAALKEDSVQLLELVEIKFRGETNVAFRFTNNPRPVKWPSGSDGNVYQPIGYARDGLTQAVGSTSNTLRVQVNDVSGEFIKFLAHREVYGARITIRQVSREYMSDSRASIILFSGIIDGPALSDEHASLNCVSTLSSRDFLVPRRVFQETCTHTCGSEWCGLDLTDRAHNHYGHTMGSISSEWEFEDNSIPYNPMENLTITDPLKEFRGNDYWKSSEVYFLTGRNAGVSRAVRRIVFSALDKSSNVQKFNTRIILRTQLPFAPADGDKYRLRRRCTKTRKDCRGRFDNLGNFGGNPHLPRTVQIKG